VVSRRLHQVGSLHCLAGESEKIARTLFDLARQHAPSVVFFDEIDALLSTRGTAGEHEASRRLKAQILTQIDGISSASANTSADALVPNHPGTLVSTSPSRNSDARANTVEQDLGGGTGGSTGSTAGRVMVLATCNRPWDLDEAMRRRLERRIYVPLPDQKAREQMLTIHTSGLKLAPSVSFPMLATSLNGFSGADVQLVCRDAAMMIMRKAIAGKSPDEIIMMQESGSLDGEITMDDFEEAIERTAPSVAPAELNAYSEWNDEFGCTSRSTTKKTGKSPARRERVRERERRRRQPEDVALGSGRQRADLQERGDANEQHGNENQECGDEGNAAVTQKVGSPENPRL